MRIMGLDFGDSRIGVALSDPLGWTAQGMETIEHKGKITDAVSRIKELIEQYDVSRIVVGFPKNMNGTVGPRGERTLEFIKLLSDKFNIEIIKWDERLTTVAAHKAMGEMGKKPSRDKKMVDKIAAVYILQGYLDSMPKE